MEIGVIHAITEYFPCNEVQGKRWLSRFEVYGDMQPPSPNQALFTNGKKNNDKVKKKQDLVKSARDSDRQTTRYAPRHAHVVPNNM